MEFNSAFKGLIPCMHIRFAIAASLSAKVYSVWIPII